MTNHTLEKPNDWWQLYLLLVNPLKLTHLSIHTLEVLPFFIAPELSDLYAPSARERHCDGWSNRREASTPATRTSPYSPPRGSPPAINKY